MENKLPAYDTFTTVDKPNIFDPNKSSFKLDKPQLMLKKPIVLDKANEKDIKKDKLKLEKQKDNVLKRKLFDKYIRIDRKNKKGKTDDNKKYETNLKKIYKKLLIKFKKEKRTDINIVEQNGPFLKPENLINISGQVEIIDYDINNIDIKKDEVIDNNIQDDAKLKKIEQTSLANAEMKFTSYKDANITDINDILFLIKLNMDASTFIELKNEFETINGDTHHEPIIENIFDKLIKNKIYDKEFKEDLKNYFEFIKKSIEKNNNPNYLHIFILMHQSFIVNHLWMLFPKDNKYFLAYVIDRIRQTIDEGRDIIVKYYTDNKKNKEFGYDVINKPSFNIFYDPETSTAVEKFGKVNFNKSSIDNFAIWNDIEKLWGNATSTVTKNDKQLIIFSGAKKGIIRFLLVNILWKTYKTTENIHYRGDKDGDSKKMPTQFTHYLSKNLFFVLTFLHTQSDIITKEFIGGYDNQEDRLLRYLIDEYNVMLEI